MDGLPHRMSAAMPSAFFIPVNYRRVLMTRDPNSDEMTRRAVINAALGNVGFSDPNQARNDRRKEIAYIRQQVKRLHADLQGLEGRRR